MDVSADVPSQKMSLKVSKMFTGQNPLVSTHYKQYLVLTWSNLKIATIGIVRFFQELPLI
jgi:hypothetical protein